MTEQYEEESKNLECTTLIWLDKHVYEQQKEQVSSTNNTPTRQQLRSIINYMKVFDQSTACENYIRNIEISQEIILIASGTYCKDIMPKIESLPQLRSVYIYCMNEQQYENFANQFSKIRGIFNDSDRLLTQLANDQKFALRSSMIPMAFFSQNKDMMQQQRILTKQNGQFLWFQLLIELMGNKAPNDEERHEGIKELAMSLHQYFHGNDVQYKKVHDFETQYEPEHAIWWYTSEPFFYSIINKALRTYDFDTIILFRMFINDMYHLLKEQYHNEQQKQQASDPHSNGSNKFQVYRGQAISFEELEQIKKNKGEFLSFNNFLSTTKNREKGLFFTDSSGAKMHGLYPILFEFQINSNAITKPYADITHFSQFDTEEEFLFMIGTICRIDEIVYDDAKCIWIARLTVMHEESYELHDVFESLKKQKINDNSLINLANILEDMGEYKQAEKIIHRRLSQLSDEQIIDQYNCFDLLGTLAGRNGNFDEAIKYHLQSIELQKQVMSIDNKQLAQSYNNLGYSYGMNDRIDQALSNLFKAIEIRSKLYDNQDHISNAGTYENIANCYFARSEFDEALKNFQRAFDIRQKNGMPEKSPESIEYYMSVGNIFGSQKQLQDAIEYHQKAIEIAEQVLPFDHPLLAVCYNNLGKDYGDRKQYRLASKNYQQALNIYQRALPDNHPERRRTQENLDEIFTDMWTEAGKYLLMVVIILLPIVIFISR